MDEKIEKVIELCGTKNKYQIILLVLAFFCWSNNMLTAVSLPFLEKMPMVEYFDENHNKHVDPLNYTICDWGNYNITEKYEYSWVIDAQIECDKFKTGTIASSVFGGNLIATLTFNLVADNLGRKYTFIFSQILYIALNTGIIFFKNYYVLISFNTVLNIFCIYTCYSMLVLSEEITSNKYRGLFGTIINAGFPSCALFFFPSFQFLSKWQYTFLINSGVATIILIIFLIFSYESPRLLISKGKVLDAVDVLEKIAKFHRLDKDFEEKIKSEEYKSIIDEILYSRGERAKEDKEKKKLGVLSLVKYASIRYRFLMLAFIGSTLSGTYNSISVWVKNFGNMFTLGMILAGAEVLVSFIAGWVIDTPLGRKGSMAGLLFIATVSFGLFAFLQNVNTITKDAFFLCIRFSVNGVFVIIYTYFLETYPTDLRAIGFGMNTTFDNIGGTLIPFLTEYMKEFYFFILLGSFNLINFILMCCLPETRGITLPETIKEVEEEEKKNQASKNPLLSDSEATA